MTLYIVEGVQYIVHIVHGVVVGDGVDYMTLYMVDGEID